jgi:hypothetical protein
MSIAGGVLLSTIVSFYLVPPLFALLMTRGKRWAPGLQVVETATDNSKLEKTPA